MLETAKEEGETEPVNPETLCIFPEAPHHRTNREYKNVSTGPRKTDYKDKLKSSLNRRRRKRSHGRGCVAHDTYIHTYIQLVGFRLNR